MKSPLVRKSSAGFSVFELVIVVVTVALITGFAIVRFKTGQVAIARVNAADEFVEYLEQARLDSNRRQTIRADQMACVIVLDNNTYSYIVDANSDGWLDPPENITISTANNLRIKGPFPKVFRFDSFGRIVDAENNVVTPPLVVFSNSRGTSTVHLSTNGKPVVVHGPQPGIGLQR
jgi:Tfp pilus assembly protein FimT